MPYTPQQAQANLDTDGLRRFNEEELRKVAAYSAELEDRFDSASGDITTLQGDVTTLQTDVGTLQTDVTDLQTKLTQADDLISSSVAPQALTSTTPREITNISVLTGTWDLEAFLQFQGAGATNTTNMRGSIDAATATMNTTLPDSGHWRNAVGVADTFFPMFLGRKRVVVVGASTPYFLNAVAVFSGGTFSAAGILTARRIIV